MIKKSWKQIKEDLAGGSSSDGVPANNVGGGKIAGLGIGPQGQPPVKLPAKRKKTKAVLRSIIGLKT